MAAEELPGTRARVTNPLTVIVTFLSFAEAMMGATFVWGHDTTDSMKWCFVGFLTLFPTFVAGAFFVVLWFRHPAFYAPRDFLSDESFLRSATLTQRREELEDRIEAARQLKQKEVEVLKVELGKGATEGPAIERIVNEIQRVATITIRDGSDTIELPLAAVPTMNALTDAVWLKLKRPPPAYSYGLKWWIVKESGGRLPSLRKEASIPLGQPARDERKLIDLGIYGGEVLEVRRLP